MSITAEEKNKYLDRVYKSRGRILLKNGFFGMLLMHADIEISESCKTASTDGKRIVFGTKLLDEISDSEIEFVLMHEIHHIILQHALRRKKRDNLAYNIACDIVVNSNILLENGMNESSITLNMTGPLMHQAAGGAEGYNYTVEELYEQVSRYYQIKKIKDEQRNHNLSAKGRARKQIIKPDMFSDAVWDDHSHWGEYEEDDTLRDVWIKNFIDTCELIKIKDPSNTRGLFPAFAQRMFTDFTEPTVDWKYLLTGFVQEDIKDYSLCPPDRRYADNPFFLPDYNDSDTTDVLKNVLFMIDTSGSVTDLDMTKAFSEIKGAIAQYDGKISGWIGFFDAAIIEPVPFEAAEDLKTIKPAGGGGTDFQIVFEYVAKNMEDNPPSNIVILTDGFAPYPKEHLANGIPVLWLINNFEVDPPWGKVARIL